MPATEDYLRDIKLMHKVFAVSAMALLGTTVWMMWADYADEWRGYQRAAMKAIADRDRAQIKAIKNDSEYREKKARADAAQSAAQEALKSKQSEVDALQKQVSTLSQQAATTMRELRVRRAERDVARAEYNLKIRDSASPAVQKEFSSKFDEAERRTAELEAQYSAESYSVVQAKTAFAALNDARDSAEKLEKDATADVARLERALQKIEPPEGSFSAFKRQLMLWPIINGFNSPEKVQQDWMPRLSVSLGMTTVQRFDRCRTCHYNIDTVAQGTAPGFPFGDGAPESGTYAHPSASHPRLDLYLTSASPHPLPKFGCTSCHEGQGSGTTFQNASHAPNDPVEMLEWEHKHHWFDNHFWEHPMNPKRFEESGCIKCHINVVELGVNSKFGPTGPKVYRGYELVKTYGCFGCHEINGFEGTKIIGVDLRLEPSGHDVKKYADDPSLVAGKMRKVGPSLRHLASKTERGWIEHWTEEPKRFRPTTRMPQFFKLDNQQDEHAGRFNPVEIAAMTTYLLAKSKPLEMFTPKDGYQPNAERGRQLLATKGCLACHSHGDVPSINANHGPDLSLVHAKIKPGQAGFNWLYTWIREPERHHPRTKMPHLFLDAEGDGEKYVDPAADIAAFLLKLSGAPAGFQPTGEYAAASVDDAVVDDLMRGFLIKILTKQQIADLLATGVYPLAVESVKGDEIELATGPAGGSLDPVEWRQRKLTYVGRKTISKYGCYGCHDIPEFESARPIGTALQDWGKKDRSRLAFEHIQEFLHHHGQPELHMESETLSAEDAARLKIEGGAGVRITGKQPGVAPPLAMRMIEGVPHKDALQVDDVILGYDGHAIADLPQLKSLLRQTVPAAKIEVTIWRQGEELTLQMSVDGSTKERVETAIGKARRGEYKDRAEEERELSAAFYFESLGHHGRPGFLWQKLRQPRSYDYRMTETKPYDDRLRMPKFPFTEEDIDSIATFVLGLTAEPPNPEYIFNPTGSAGAKIRGEQLLQQFNCAGCHMLELPEIQYAADPEKLASTDVSGEFPAAVELLRRLKPARNGVLGETLMKVGDEFVPRVLVGFHGLIAAYPNPDDDPEDQEYVAELWETLKIGKFELLPTEKLIFPKAAMKTILPAKGGRYAEWLADRLLKTGVVKQMPLAWQASPPPLYREGIKVQTPWLFNFLRNPEKIRHTTVLRMPRFNMSADDAQALANYFAAEDGATYPYQPLPQREATYLAEKNAAFHAEFPAKSHDYLAETWKVLNSPLCVKCHAVGGRIPVSTDPEKDIRAPNLEMAGERLRPDWMQLWLYKPPWITPYTSMPQNFPPGKENLKELFDGKGDWQTVAVRDALMNYHRLMERDGRIVYEPPMAPTTNPAGAAALERPGDAPAIAGSVAPPAATQPAAGRPATTGGSN